MADQDPMQIKSTSKRSAECSDIVLRETNTTQLVFRPMLVENPRNDQASVNGTFIFQCKGRNDEWENLPSIPLSQLKKGEGFKLKVKSKELLYLYEEISSLYELYAESGIPQGESQYIKVNKQITELVGMPQYQLAQFLSANRQFGSTLLSRLVEWAVSADDPTALVERLVDLGQDSLKKLNVAVGIQSLRTAIDIWKKNSLSTDEEFWQSTLTENSFVLEQIFSWPVTIVKGKAYVGGKTVENVGGSIVDFLIKNQLTQNAALIEIKTPGTPLLGREYRNSIYNLSEDLSGAVMQVLNYRHTLSEQYTSLTRGQGSLFESFNPECVIIVGNAQTQLEERDQRKSFELFRRQLPGVHIITYDEMFAKAENLIGVLESPYASSASDEEDVPFRL